MVPHGSWKYPVPNQPKFVKDYDFSTPTQVQYDEVVFDYNTNSYITIGQQLEIQRLKAELKVKNETKRQKLKNIIGYYYKR